MRPRWARRPPRAACGVRAASWQPMLTLVLPTALAFIVLLPALPTLMRKSRMIPASCDIMQWFRELFSGVHAETGSQVYAGWGDGAPNAWSSAGELSSLREPTGTQLGVEYTHCIDDLAQVDAQGSSVAGNQAVQHLRNVSEKQFNTLIAQGVPFVIDDAGEGLPLLRKPCSWYSGRWPHSSMRAEYHSTSAHSDWDIFYEPVHKEMKISLGDSSWWRTSRPLANDFDSTEHMIGAGARLNAPYIWHVKDQELLETKQEVQRWWLPPYFLNASLSNAWQATETIEFCVRGFDQWRRLWPSRFALVGGGAMAHTDSYCDTAVSLQLKGAKRWRLMLLPPLDRVAGFEDGQIYGSGRWVHEFETTVREGAAIVVPPAYVHETYVAADDNEAGACTVASTFRLALPAAAHYLRAFIPRLAMSALQHEERCVSHAWSYMALLRDEPIPVQTDAYEHASSLLLAIDADDDELISPSELRNFMQSSFRPSLARRLAAALAGAAGQRPSESRQRALEEELFDAAVRDAWTFQDLDRDNRISQRELAQAVRRWLLSLRRYVTASSHRSPRQEGK